MGSEFQEVNFELSLFALGGRHNTAWCSGPVTRSVLRGSFLVELRVQRWSQGPNPGRLHASQVPSPPSGLSNPAGAASHQSNRLRGANPSPPLRAAGLPSYSDTQGLGTDLERWPGDGCLVFLPALSHLMFAGLGTEHTNTSARQTWPTCSSLAGQLGSLGAGVLQLSLTGEETGQNLSNLAPALRGAELGPLARLWCHASEMGGWARAHQRTDHVAPGHGQQPSGVGL